jgi:hypothetical protein
MRAEIFLKIAGIIPPGVKSIKLLAAGAALVFLFSAPLITCAAAAETVAAGGEACVSVDIGMVYALHPLMQYYDPGLNLFIRPPDARTDDEFSKEIQKRNAAFELSKVKYAPEIDKLKSKITTLGSDLKKLENEKADEISKASENLAGTLSSAKNNKTGGKSGGGIDFDKIYDIGKTYDAKIDKARKQLKEAETEYAGAHIKSMGAHYLNAEESAELMKKIDSEIAAAASAVAAVKKAGLIVNRGFAEFIKDRNSGGEIKEDAAAAESSEISIFMKGGFNAFAGRAGILTPAGEAPDYSKALFFYRSDSYRLEDDEAGNGANIFKKNIAGRIKLSENSLRMSNAVKKPDFVKEIGTDLFEGTDITPAVIIYILRDHGFSKEQAEDIFKAVNEI